MTKKDLLYFSIARSASLLSDYNGVSKKMGCVIVHKNTVISIGHNLYKTHPLQKKYNVYRNIPITHNNIHAETMAIIKAKRRDFSGCSIYIYRELNNGLFGLARPCNACIQMLKEHRLSRLFYTTPDGYAMEEIEL